MNTERLNTWLSFTANVGVILGLIFLAVELRQNSGLMRVQISQSRADAAMASNESSFNSDYLPQIIVKTNAGEELSAEETIRYRDWFRASNRNQDNVLNQYSAGMLSGNSPRSVRDFVENVVGASKHAREEWEIQKISYTDEYVALVEEVIGVTENQ
jgi:hypothetical protein